MVQLLHEESKGLESRERLIKETMLRGGALLGLNQRGRRKEGECSRVRSTAKGVDECTSGAARGEDEGCMNYVYYTTRVKKRKVFLAD
jgi:hypothetical protein